MLVYPYGQFLNMSEIPEEIHSHYTPDREVIRVTINYYQDEICVNFPDNKWDEWKKIDKIWLLHAEYTM